MSEAEKIYHDALLRILTYWADDTQDAPPDQPRIQWAEEMAGIACDALEKVKKLPRYRCVCGRELNFAGCCNVHGRQIAPKL